MIKIPWPLIIILFLAHFLTGSTREISDAIVKVSAPEVLVDAGDGSVIHVKIEVKKGYHIQANKVNDKFLIPTTIKINSDKKIIPGKQLFPRSKKFKIEGTDKFLDVYDGFFEVIIPFKTHSTIQKGMYILESKLHYQACDSRICLSPKIIDFSVRIKVT
jgi:Disulphide bond corrector protein DsbC